MAGEASQQSLPFARPGTVLKGKYRVERQLAQGGMGTVVVATHLQLERPVALKLLDLAGKDRAYVGARFLREARAAARLAGDHVVRIIDLDEAPDGTPFLVMELLEGRDLEAVLQAEGSVPPERAVNWTLQACAALAEAHARGVVHRDVKPSNLFLVTRPDGVELVKLLDFGISKMVDDALQLTRTQAALGSPLFMSPEQLLSPKVVDPRSDVWSLGVTLYRLLCGEAPFDAPDASSLAAQIAARPPTPLAEVAADLPQGLRDTVMRCLEKEPDRRWPSVLALAEALEPFRSPTGLGSLAAVRLADAQGRAAPPALAAPAAAAPAPGSWTLSHDVPRPAPAEEPPAPLGVVPPVADAPPAPAPRRTSWGLLGLGAGVALAAGLGVVALRRPDVPATPHDPASLAAAPAPGATAPSVPPGAPAAAAPVPGAGPLDTTAAAAPDRPRADAGAVVRVRPARPGAVEPKDPSDLELK